MNFAQFLKTGKMLRESHTADCVDPVVVGYGSFSPCHIGYLQLVADLVTLGEQHDAEPILIIVEQNCPKYQSMLANITHMLAASYPFLKFQVEFDVAAPLVRLSELGRTPRAILGERKYVQEAAQYHKMLFETQIAAHTLDLSEYHKTSIAAVIANNLEAFRASILETSPEMAQIMFDLLREG